MTLKPSALLQFSKISSVPQVQLSLAVRLHETVDTTFEVYI